MSYSLRKEQIIQDVEADGGDGDDGLPGLASDGEQGGADAHHSESGRSRSVSIYGSDSGDEPPVPPELSSGDSNDMPGMVSDADDSDVEDMPHLGKALRTPHQRRTLAKAARAAMAAVAGASKAKAAASPRDADGNDELPALLSDGEASQSSGEEGEEPHTYPRQAEAASAAAKPGPPFSTGYFGAAAAKLAATPERSRTAYGGEGAGRREDLRAPPAQSAGPSQSAAQPAAAQQQQQQQQQAAASQVPGLRKPAPAPVPVVVEKVEAQVAQDGKIREALRLEEEERKALRKKMGLEEDEEAEVEDRVLGPCSYGEQCNKDRETHAVKASHANRYEFRCSAGHKLFFHRECWLKTTVRWVDLKEQEHVKEGRDFKFNSYKKEHRRKCILPGCDGTVTFIEGPNKYCILNIEEEVRKELAGKELEEEDELPEWELYKQQERRERRFRFKKGKGKKAADEDEEEDPAPQPPKRGPQPSLDAATPVQQEQQERQQADGVGASSAAAAAEETDEPTNPTPALPDDQLLRALKRESSEDELLGLAKGRKVQTKDKGKPAAQEVADIVYEEGGGGKKKKGKGVKLLLDAGLSIAEQRRLQHQQAAAAGLEAGEAAQRPQRLADNLLEFPDLQEAAQLAKERRDEDEERMGRQLYSAALLGALRSYRAEADDLRPDDLHGPSTVLVENLDYNRMRDEEGTRPEMFLRSTFAEYGPVKELQMYEACRAAIVSFRSTAAAYKAFVLLSQKTLLHSRLSAIMLKQWPKEQDVEAMAQAALEQQQWQQEEGVWEDEGAAATGSLASYSLHEDRPGSSASGDRAPLFLEQGKTSPDGVPSLSITIPGSAAQHSGVNMPGSTGHSFGNSLKVDAREFVPGSSGSFGSPAFAVSPLSATAAAAALGAASATGRLRVAASEFRPGGPAGAAGAAGTAGVAAAQAGTEDPLLNQFLSGQLIQANSATLGVYMAMGDDKFGIQSIYLERVGVISPGQVALLMFNQDTGTLHGVWSAQRKEHASTPNELVAFGRERVLPPLAATNVQACLQWQGGAPRLPQKIAAANISSIMRAFIDLERSQQAIGRAAAAAAAAPAAAPTPAAAPPAAPPPVPAAQQAQQAQQERPGDAWWAEHERRRREQEKADAELARQLQEQLLAEEQLARQRQAEEDARLAAALQSSAREAAQLAQPSGWAAAAARPPAPPPAPAAAAPAASPPRPPGPPGGGIFASLFPGQRSPGVPAAPPAAAVLPRGPPPGASSPRPYRPPAMGGYRPPMGPVAAPAAASVVASALAAPAAPAASAAPVAAPGPVAVPPPPAVAAPAAPAVPAVLKNPCPACKARESVHIWIPCGHHGHCQVCLGDDVPKEEKLPRFPACLLCGRKAEYYIRVFS